MLSSEEPLMKNVKNLFKSIAKKQALESNKLKNIDKAAQL